MKTNKLVFGKILAILIGIYLLIVPLSHHLNERFKDFANRYRIPVAQNYQILLFFVATVIIEPHLGLAKKAGELRELCSWFSFVLILGHPYNHESFSLKGLALWRRKVPFEVEKVPGS